MNFVSKMMNFVVLDDDGLNEFGGNLNQFELEELRCVVVVARHGEFVFLNLKSCIDNDVNSVSK